MSDKPNPSREESRLPDTLGKKPAKPRESQHRFDVLGKGEKQRELDRKLEKGEKS